MATSTHRSRSAGVWALVRRQYGVVSKAQLLALGYTDAAIRHRLASGRLHRVYRGVYAVGRRELTMEGRWRAAALAAGEDAGLGAQSAAELWGYRPRLGGAIEIVVPARTARRIEGLMIHRSDVHAERLTEHRGIPVVDVPSSFVQIAARLSRGEIERAVNEADRLELIHPDALRRSLEELRGKPGVRPLREALDCRTFAMSRSELERAFRGIARDLGLPKPETCVMHNGYEVDFLWRDLGLVLETDSLRHHRTAAQQTRDRERDQAHLASGDQPVRFTHAQVFYERPRVERALHAIVRTIQTRRRLKP